MTDISTKKTIEIWNASDDSHWVVEPATDFCVLLRTFDEEGRPSTLFRFDPHMIGPLCKALHEVAQNVLENYREDDDAEA